MVMKSNYNQSLTST